MCSPPTGSKRKVRLIGTEAHVTWNNMLGWGTSYTDNCENAVQRFALNARPDKSKMIKGQTGLYCQICTMRNIWNPNQNAVVGRMSIRALQHCRVTRTSNKEDSRLHCYMSQFQLRAFVLSCPQHPHTYYNGITTHCHCCLLLH